MFKPNKNITIGNNSYLVTIEVIPNLYTKLQIFENSIDITNSVMSNQPLFNELLGSMALPKLHHTTPKFLLANWKDSNNFFHEIIIEKKSSNISFKSNHVINEKKKIKKYLHPKFSGLHKYTFNFDNRIIIFEGAFINLVEKYIMGVLDYIDLMEKNLDGIQKIKNIEINFPNETINFTDIITNSIKSLAINNTIINDVNSLHIKDYNRVIGDFYINCLFHYTSIYEHNLFFENVYKCFNQNIPIHGLEATIYMYFFGVSNQTQSELSNWFGNDYTTTYIKAPDNYKYPISEIWKIQTMDENNKYNTIIPISPEYAILISSDLETSTNFKKRISNNNIFLKAFIDNQLNIIKNLEYDKYKENTYGEKEINNNYSVLCPNEETKNIIHQHLLSEYLLNQYIKNKDNNYRK